MKRLVLERTDGHHAYKRGVLILTGGQSSRMGQNKANLPWQGGTFLTKLLKKTRAVDPIDIVISANASLDLHLLPGQLYASHPLSDRQGHVALSEAEMCAIKPDHTMRYQWVMKDEPTLTVYVVPDQGESRGPLSGLLAGLTVGRSEVYMTVSIDMPFFNHFSFGSTCEMLKQLGKAPTDCVVPTLAGRLEPLAALYSRRCVDSIKTLLANGEFHVRALFDKVKTEYIAVDDRALDYRNVNTPLDYKMAQALLLNTQRKVPMIFVVAEQSKTGKTLVSTELIKAFTKLGYEVGYAKSDGHGFTMDREGSDTWLASQAGAKAIAISGPTQYAMLVSHNKKKDIVSLAENLLVDLVIVETRSRGMLPSIEVLPSHTESSKEDSLGANSVINGSFVVADVKAGAAQSEDFERAHFSLTHIDDLAMWLKQQILPTR